MDEQTKQTEYDADCAYRQAARTQYGSDGFIEIDSDAIVSRGADSGVYVQAWVWVEACSQEGTEP